MDLRRRLPSKPPRPSPSPSPAAAPTTKHHHRIQASDALPLPIRHTNKLFSFLFMASLYFLMSRWREKIRSSAPLHLLSLSEILAVSAFVSSLIYLISFFGIAYVQSFISHDENEEIDEKPTTCPLLDATQIKIPYELPLGDREIVESVVSGEIPSYILESNLNDTHRAAKLRRESLKIITGRRIDGLPPDGFDYDSILGQCCEMPVGYVQLPVGIAGPLALDGRAYYVPMATTEGCLVASTNRGCKAIGESSGAMSVVLRDGMTRAPVVRFGNAKRAAELKFFLEEPVNFETLSLVFNK